MLLKECINSLLIQTVKPNILVIDGGSKDGTLDYLNMMAKKSELEFLNIPFESFSKSNNFGLRREGYDYYLLINDDAHFTHSEQLKKLIDLLIKYKEYGILGTVANRHIHQDFKIESSYEERLKIGQNLLKKDDEIIEVVGRSLPFFCVLIKRECKEQVGLLDERFLIGNSEDDDYCRRARLKKWKVGVAKNVFVWHYTNASLKYYSNRMKIVEKNREKYKKKWNL